jgi:energy-coupling factor transport system permease protein
MDSRGYGRTGAASRTGRRVTSGLMLAGLGGLCLGAYGLLDSSAPRALGFPTTLGGAALCVGGLVVGGRRVRRTRYRPDPWRLPEWLVACSGALVAAVIVSGAGFDPAALTPAFSPLRWPAVPLVPVLAIMVAALGGLAAPPPVRRRVHQAPPARFAPASAAIAPDLTEIATATDANGWVEVRR